MCLKLTTKIIFFKMSLDENLWAEIFDDVDQDLSLLFDPLLAEIPDIANAGHDQVRKSSFC